LPTDAIRNWENPIYESRWVRACERLNPES
jgi:hypothetical protein